MDQLYECVWISASAADKNKSKHKDAAEIYANLLKVVPSLDHDLRWNNVSETSCGACRHVHCVLESTNQHALTLKDEDDGKTLQALLHNNMRLGNAFPGTIACRRCDGRVNGSNNSFLARRPDASQRALMVWLVQKNIVSGTLCNASIDIGSRLTLPIYKVHAEEGYTGREFEYVHAVVKAVITATTHAPLLRMTGRCTCGMTRKE
jgi:hypothetical protein